MVRRTVAAVQPRKPTKGAEAIAIAARQPEMRFVSPKSEDQQARAAVFRGRERLVRPRTELMNALRATVSRIWRRVPYWHEPDTEDGLVADRTW